MCNPDAHGLQAQHSLPAASRCCCMVTSEYMRETRVQTPCLYLHWQVREAGRTVALLQCLQRLATAGAVASAIVAMPGVAPLHAARLLLLPMRSPVRTAAVTSRGTMSLNNLGKHVHVSYNTSCDCTGASCD